MFNLKKLFNNRKVRGAWDPKRKIYWYSVVDVLAALRNTDYDTARNHWKQIKFRLGKGRAVRMFRQVRMPAKDGSQRFTDVMCRKDIIALIQNLPGNSAKPFRTLTGRITAGTAAMAKIFDGLRRDGYELTLYELQTVTMRKIF